ncbi:zeta-carotene desaturase /three-step phytoene desaturase [Ureibacillus xyleni]|uniref:Zeta-carotene desaturase /three-step phytoene desaturase n=1 Tax=Ureibacillus xyleni TaxID=614648 RepID=A0A285T8X0_9BACL|nr:NAD(P)/FAD-dependent oxidoreductase [Ureibacillus xyleni]SOC18015.1 zeta-carotene desaturase /three-step phytoene desaturase [Ureibacillus xyleni]
MKYFDVIVIGTGLAGLTAALELVENGKSVIIFEKEKVIGGRTSSWDEDGMIVESGFHRHIGYYKELPRVLRKVGVDPDKIVQWEENVDVRIKGKKDTATFGMSPIFGPIDMLKGVLGNNDILSWKDKLSLARFFVNGFIEYLKNPDSLDRASVRDYAKKHHVSEHALHYAVIPLSAGIFFLPPERYSCKVFFGLFLPAIQRFYRMRIGGYLGGMTELFAEPIANYIKKLGGEIRTESPVKRLLVEDRKVKGVILEDGSTVNANYIVLAADIGSAKTILKEPFLHDAAFHRLFQLKTMPAVTVQMEFTKPVLPYDRTTFGPLTSLASFAEQSRSTFTHVPGRLSIILTPPEKYLTMDHEEIVRQVQKEGKELGLDLESSLTNYRVVSRPEDFYSLEPNNDRYRPEQKTAIEGLVLAGDYTRQPYFATMEGAVVSGIKAAKIILQS